jgi:4-hydroxybenzoate polyprenyltransferase
MKDYLSLVKFSHTIFAMPFAILGFVLGVNAIENGFSLQKFFLVILCMVTARNAAMAFNRYIDSDIDKLNIRTAIREIPAGILKGKSVLIFVIGNGLLFILSTYFINSLCFYLSPVALIIILGYSLTKRFTFLCHLILGVGLGLAPVGAYLAVTERFNLVPILLGLAVLFWVAGFDVIYALQDEEFDKSNGLFSIPSYFGKEKGLQIAKGLHFISGSFICWSLWLMHTQIGQLGFLSWMACPVFIGLLLYQHSLVSPKDLSRVNLAFFTTNGIASVVFATFIVLDFYYL